MKTTVEMEVSLNEYLVRIFCQLKFEIHKKSSENLLSCTFSKELEKELKWCEDETQLQAYEKQTKFNCFKYLLKELRWDAKKPMPLCHLYLFFENHKTKLVNSF